jgi:hypothetical protein
LYAAQKKETSMPKLVSAFIVALALLAQSATAQNMTPLTSEELNRRTVERRAVDAVIWGLPLVGEDAVKQAYFRDGKAKTITTSSGAQGWRVEESVPHA